MELTDTPPLSFSTGHHRGKISLKDTRYINCCPTDSQINTVHIKECIVYLLEYNHLFNDKGFQLKFQFAIPAPPEFI